VNDEPPCYGTCSICETDPQRQWPVPTVTLPDLTAGEPSAFDRLCVHPDRLERTVRPSEVQRGNRRRSDTCSGV
jgi:hypothetical protein